MIRWFVTAILLTFSLPLLAQDKSAETYNLDEIGRVVETSGNVERMGVEDELSHKVKLGEAIFQYDKLATGKESNLKIKLLDGTDLSLSENTQLQLTRYLYDPSQKKISSLFDLFRGEVLSLVSEVIKAHEDNTYEMETPNSVVGVRGSEYLVRVNDEGTRVFSLVSPAYIQNREGKVLTLDPNQSVLVHKKLGIQNPEPFAVNEIRQRFLWRHPQWIPPKDFRRLATRTWRPRAGIRPPRPWVREWHPHRFSERPLWHPEKRLKKRQERRQKIRERLRERREERQQQNQ